MSARDSIPISDAAADAPRLSELEKQLVELDLDIAKAKRHRREQKSELKSKAAAKLDTGDIEKKLKKSKEALDICKATRKEIIARLLDAEAAETKATASAK